jgi:hypothetical protein
MACLLLPKVIQHTAAAPGTLSADNLRRVLSSFIFCASPCACPCAPRNGLYAALIKEQQLGGTARKAVFSPSWALYRGVLRLLEKRKQQKESMALAARKLQATQARLRHSIMGAR